MKLGVPTGESVPHEAPLSRWTVDRLSELVPLLMVGMHGWDDDRRINTAQAAWRPVIDCADVQIPGKGKRMRTEQFTGGAAIMYGGPTQMIEFRALATAIAAMAYQPGGITILGMHWCTDHAECEVAAAYAERINALPIHGPERPPERPVDTVRLAGVS